MKKNTLAILFFLPALAQAVDDDIPSAEDSATTHRVQPYHTPREKRAAGRETKLSPWLTFSGLAQVEATSFDHQFRNAVPNFGRDDAVSSVQLSFKSRMSDQVEAQVVLEFEENKSAPGLDEALIEFNSGAWEWSVGRQMVPFGAYYSTFITGPLLEFGETTKTSLMVGYDYHNFIEFSAAAFKGDARQANAEPRIRDWAAALEVKFFDERLLMGVSYLSDLADSDAQLLEESNHLYQRKVAAGSAYAVLQIDPVEISFEGVQAARTFREFAANANQPRAWNIEVSYFPSPHWQIAARFERSTELPEHPQRRYGLAATWLVYPDVTLAFEYLHADFKPGFVFDDADNELQRQTLYAMQLSLEF